MPVWTILVWLIIGAAAGFLAPRIFGGTAPGGQLGDLALGVIGAVAGGYGILLTGLGGGATVGALILTVAGAVIGAALLVWVARQFKKAA